MAKTGYRRVLSRIITFWKPDYELDATHGLEGSSMERLSTAIERAVENARSIIITHIFTRVIRESFGVSFPHAIDVEQMISVFGTYLESRLVFNFKDKVTERSYVRPPLLLARPRGDVARVLDPAMFERWEIRIRRIIPLLRAVVISYHTVRAKSALPARFLELNLWDYYKSMNLGHFTSYRDAIPFEVREDLQMDQVEEVMRILHFFHEDDDYGILLFRIERESLLDAYRDRLRTFIENR